MCPALAPVQKCLFGINGLSDQSFAMKETPLTSFQSGFTRWDRLKEEGLQKGGGGFFKDSNLAFKTDQISALAAWMEGPEYGRLKNLRPQNGRPKKWKTKNWKTQKMEDKKLLE